MKTVLEVLRLASGYLEKRQVPGARRQAEELVSQALGIGRLELYLGHDRPLQEHELTACRSFLERRARGEPLVYIAGKVAFGECMLRVTPAVLIPRQETELLMEQIAKELEAEEGGLEGKVFLDLCCGSGCLGLAIKKRYPMLSVILSDVSPAALSIAAENSRSNDLSVELLEGDLLQPFAGRKAHFVVCNPPYIAENEWPTLEREVRDFEPRLALIAGECGLEFYQRLASELPAHLTVAARLWLEIGATQGQDLFNIFSGPFWQKPCISQDLSGKDRFFAASTTNSCRC